MKPRVRFDLQLLLVEWLLGCVVVAMGLPLFLSVGFTAALTNTPLHAALEHGELFLSSGSGVATASVVLAGSALAEGDRQWIGTAVAFVLIFAVLPYGIWALILVRSLAGESYNVHFATRGGWIFVCVSLFLTLCLCLAARATSD